MDLMTCRSHLESRTKYLKPFYPIRTYLSIVRNKSMHKDLLNKLLRPEEPTLLLGVSILKSMMSAALAVMGCAPPSKIR
jgi:hypothetical protein